MPFTSECARSPAGPPPDVAADTPTHSRREFCLALKTARERRGLTIAQIAETTKVCPSHFEALERGELRLWPKGLYRRTFFRGYVTMVGLPVTDMLGSSSGCFRKMAPAAARVRWRSQRAECRGLRSTIRGADRKGRWHREF
jgi:hypothetical protein